jgi:dTDP-4-amino-4,6-dideoxygalactose transaminase
MEDHQVSLLDPTSFEAEQYRVLLADSHVEPPCEAPYAKHVYHLFVLRMKERKAVGENLRSLGIASSIYYPLAINQLEPYRCLGYGHGTFPEAERAAQETLAIPLYPEMTDDEIEMVASGVKEALALAESRR